MTGIVNRVLFDSLTDGLRGRNTGLGQLQPAGAPAASRSVPPLPEAAAQASHATRGRSQVPPPGPIEHGGLGPDMLAARAQSVPVAAAPQAVQSVANNEARELRKGINRSGAAPKSGEQDDEIALRLQVAMQEALNEAAAEENGTSTGANNQAGRTLANGIKPNAGGGKSGGGGGMGMLGSIMQALPGLLGGMGGMGGGMGGLGAMGATGQCGVGPGGVGAAPFSGGAGAAPVSSAGGAAPFSSASGGGAQGKTAAPFSSTKAPERAPASSSVAPETETAKKPVDGPRASGDTTKKIPGGPDRSQFDAELENPAVQQRLKALTVAEVGSHPQAQRALMETIFNRAQATGRSLTQTMDPRYYQPMQKGGAAYRRAEAAVHNSPALQRQLDEALRDVRAGSNVSNYATDNSSAGVAAAAARSQVITARIGGETFSRKEGRRNGVSHPDYRPWLRDHPRNA